MSQPWPNYAHFWRWHFYAGLFCIPFVLVLSVTGSIYLFRPQIEAWQDRDFDALKSGSFVGYAEQVRETLQQVPDSKFVFLQRRSFKEHAQANDGGEGQTHAEASRIMLSHQGQRVRVYVDPVRNAALQQVIEDERFIRVVRRIHGELLLGKRGSYLVELAASWTIVMVLTGMVLWMPQQFRFAGVLYPRLREPGKAFWKDLHSVGGFWASLFIVFLIVTGLPWSTFWGDHFKTMRRLTGTNVVSQAWEGGHETHQDHVGNEPTETSERPSVSNEKPKSGPPAWRRGAPDPATYDLKQIDVVASFASTLDFLPPVIISPPSSGDSVWTIQSETANRPFQQTMKFDAINERVLHHDRFTDRHWIDQVVGHGIALHEGQRFGLLNQLIALFTTGTLVMLSCSGLVLWWRRRKGRGLSPPAPNHKATTGRDVSLLRVIGLTIVVLALAIYLPLFGISLLIVLTLDGFVFRCNRRLSNFLGRSPPTSPESV